MEEKGGILSNLASWGPFGFIAEHIRYKLMAALLALALIPLILLGVVAYNTAASALDEEALDQLRAVETAKTLNLEAWIADREGEARFTQELVVVKGTEGVDEGLPVLVRFKDNPDSEAFQQAYRRADVVLAAFVEDMGGGGIYEDISLVDLEGDALYALDDRTAGTNVLETGELDPVVFENAQKTVYIGDMRLNPIHDDIQLQMGAPVHDDSGTLVGIIVMEISLDALSELMQESTGLGETGETYLVGQDNLFRSDSRFLGELGVESTILNEELTVNSQAVQAGLAGEHGFGIIQDYRGVDVLSAWSPIVVHEPTEADPDGIQWVLVAEIDEAEVLEPVVNLAWITFGVVAGAALMVIVAAYVISGALIRQIESIMNVFGQIGIGDFDARAEIRSNDELGTMAMSLNAMLDNTLALIQSREERDHMQSSIMKLLEEVSGIAEGDLTVEAEVTADMTGAIADAFNFTVAELRQIISRVQDATLQVSSSANEIQATAEHLAQGSESQASQIVDTSAAIDEMAVSIQQVSENAALSTTVGEQALNNARQGAKSVQNTIEGMNRIRNQVQETAKRIKRLGESSQEIGEIVQLIGDIADRTSILALNASIQAAMAGEAGRGFAVVAEEVERLADRSTNATKQIDTLIKTIQSETTEAVAAMEDTTHEVVSGSQLANDAGQALEEIQSVSDRLSELIQSISLASKQQARGSEVLARSMNDISEVTQQTAAGTKQAAVSISNLAALADDLRSSLSTFKLPGSNGTNGQGE